MLGNIRNAYSICIHLIKKKCLPNCCIVHCALLHTQTAKHHGCNEFVHCCMPRPQSIIVFHNASTANTRMSLSYTGAADGEGQRGGGVLAPPPPPPTSESGGGGVGQRPPKFLQMVFFLHANVRHSKPKVASRCRHAANYKFDIAMI